MNLPPDHSQIVYRFADGWTIRRATVIGDEVRTIKLMGLDKCQTGQTILKHAQGRLNAPPDTPPNIDLLGIFDPQGQPQAIFTHGHHPDTPHDRMSTSAIARDGHALRNPKLLHRIAEFDGSRPYASRYQPAIQAHVING